MARQIDKDTEIVITNNLHGGFFYQTPNGSLVIDMEDFGSDDYITFGELKTMMARSRKILQNLHVVITSVISDDVTIEDVVTALKLKDSYDELLSLADEKLADVDYIDIETIPNFVSEADADRLAKILNNKKSKLRFCIAESAVELFKKDELNDYNKMNILAEKLGHERMDTFWRDIRDSAK